MQWSSPDLLKSSGIVGSDNVHANVDFDFVDSDSSPNLLQFDYPVVLNILFKAGEYVLNP